MHTLQRPITQQHTHRRVPTWRSGALGACGVVRPHSARCLASGSSNNSSTSNFEETLGKAGKAASVKFKEFAETAQDSAQRTWRKLDAEYALKDKAQRAARRLEEQARDQYNVRRRLRSSVEHVQRMWPVWSKQLEEFSGTWYGKATLFMALFLLITSPIFWRLLNILLIVWWLAIPLGAALLNNAQRRAAEQAAAEAEERARAQNPFADMFRARAAAGGMGRGGQGRSSYQQSGPVIDADYVIIEDDKNNRK